MWQRSISGRYQNNVAWLYLKVATLITLGLSGLPLALTIVTGKVAAYLLGWAAAVAAGFIFTWLIGFTDPEE